MSWHVPSFRAPETDPADVAIETFVSNVLDRTPLAAGGQVCVEFMGSQPVQAASTDGGRPNLQPQLEQAQNITKVEAPQATLLRLDDGSTDGKSFRDLISDSSPDRGHDCKLVLGHLEAQEADEDCPKLKVQEKNRKAQQRFRARQKARLAEKEEQVQDLMLQLSSLLKTSNSLRQQNGLLNRMLQMGDKGPMDALQATQALTPESGLLPSQAPAQLPLPSQPPGVPPGTCCMPCIPSTPLVPSQPWPQPRPPLQLLPPPPVQAEAPEGNPVLNVKEGQPVRLSPMQVRGLRPDTFKLLLKEYVNQLTLLLMDLDDTPGTAAHKRMSQVSMEASTILLQFALANPSGFRSIASTHLEDPMTGAGGEDRDIWLVVMRTLALTPQQKTELAALRSTHLARLSGLLRQRRSNIQALINTSSGFLNAVHTSQRYLQIAQAVDSMHTGLQEENRNLVEFMSGCCTKVLTPVQTARLLVQSYPWLPDIMSITSWVAYELGDTNVIDTLSSQSVPSWSHSDSSPMRFLQDV